MLLVEPDTDDAAGLGEGDPLPPVAPLPDGRTPCEGHDEPMVALEGSVGTFDAYAALGIFGPRELRVRRTVRDRLVLAQDALPAGLSLVVLDAWRTLDEQRGLIDHYEQFGSTAGYVAAVHDDAMRPPHATGGAVDLTLAADGRYLALGSDYDSFKPEAHYDTYEQTDGVVRRLRRALHAAMGSAGFVPYPLEWWHWSYGDDVWGSALDRDSLFDLHH